MNTRLDWDTDGLDWPHRQASRFVSAAGLTWHIQQLGNGPPLLLIHGTAASTHSWRGLAPLLAKTHTVLSLDLPGHAFTSPLAGRPMTILNVANAIGELLRVLKFEPGLVIGHSAGAAILIRMCRDRLITPSDGLISINGALLPYGGFPGRLFMPLARAIAANPLVASLFSWRANDLSAVERVLTGTGSRIDAHGLELYARLFRNKVHTSSALDMMANWDLDSTATDIAKLPMPVALIASGGDLAVAADDAFAVQARAPNAAVVFVRSLGHLAHEEAPDIIAAHMSSRLHPSRAVESV